MAGKEFLKNQGRPRNRFEMEDLLWPTLRAGGGEGTASDSELAHESFQGFLKGGLRLPHFLHFFIYFPIPHLFETGSAQDLIFRQTLIFSGEKLPQFGFILKG